MKREIENGMWKLTADDGCVLCNGMSYVVDAPVYMRFNGNTSNWFDVVSLPEDGGQIPDSEAIKIILGKDGK